MFCKEHKLVLTMAMVRTKGRNKRYFTGFKFWGKIKVHWSAQRCKVVATLLIELTCQMYLISDCDFDITELTYVVKVTCVDTTQISQN